MACMTHGLVKVANNLQDFIDTHEHISSKESYFNVIASIKDRIKSIAQTC